MPKTLEQKTIEQYCVTTLIDGGDQACIQIAVGLNLPYIDVKNALDGLVAAGKVQRYIPSCLEYLHLAEHNIYFYGIPREPFSWKRLFSSPF